MRKFLALLLLSTVATPALADPGDMIRRHSGDREARSERQSTPRETRSQNNNNSSGQNQSGGNHNDGGNRHDSPRVQLNDNNSGGNDGGNQSRPTFRSQRSGGNDAPQVNVNEDGGGNATVRRGGNWRRVQDTSGGEQPAVIQNGGGDTNVGRRMEDRVRVVRPQIVDQGDVSQQPGQPSLRQLERPLPRVMQNRTPVISRTPREGTQPPLRVENRRRNNINWTTWSHNWRNDRRYDWREHRRRHRSHFHLGIYFDPFGWNYRPYSIGWRLWPSYYSSRYWINDPWFYRLPYAPPGYRWIRYWDDALLVDTFTGEVVDVIHNFFW